KLMFHLMNEARIATGLQALGGMEACLNLVEEYANTRTQFGRPLMNLPLYKKNYLDWKTEVDGIRVLLMDTLYHFDLYQHLHMKEQQTGTLNQDEQQLYKEAKKIVRRRTPLV